MYCLRTRDGGRFPYCSRRGAVLLAYLEQLCPEKLKNSQPDSAIWADILSWQETIKAKINYAHAWISSETCTGIH